MGITVSDIYTKFPLFKPEDMVKLVGRTDFNGRTQINLSNIARYRGSYDQDLSIFTAKEEGKSFINLLSGKKKTNVAENAGINISEPAQMGNKANKPQNAQAGNQQNNQPNGLLGNNNNANAGANANANGNYKPLFYLA